RRGGRHLGQAGQLDLGDPGLVARKSRNFYLAMAGVGAAIVLAVLLVRSGALALPLTRVAQSLGVVIVGLTVLYFIYLLVAGGHTSLEKRRLGVIFWLFLLVALFWSGFEQAGSSLNLFAERLTDRVMLGWEMPASWLQSVNSFFIILLAPVFGILWTSLASRRANPSIPVKFGLGLLGLAMGFFVIAWGAANATAEDGASPAWLVVMYFLHTCGELAISPVGLSAMTKLAPRNRVGQMMGVWFVGAALGNLIAGLVAGTLGGMAPTDLFRTVALITGGVGLFALVVSPAIKRLMGDVE
ncbi:MAG TPA: oligopeptide:H+ symporter, partial [Gemmatimonadota bacterium]|nr:oligopeptide:H+ symporter [Gemmatimonadota bacterium]